MSVNTQKTYDNSPAGIRNLAIQRAKKEFSTVENVIRNLGLSEEQISSDLIRQHLVQVKESFIINSRQKHIEDPFAQFEVAQPAAVLTEVVPAPKAFSQSPVAEVVVQAPVAPVVTTPAQ